MDSEADIKTTQQLYQNQIQKPHPVIFIAAMATARLFLNMTRRFAYPFLPEISSSLHVSLGSVQGAVGSYAFIGVGSPFLYGFSTRFGRKRMMLVGLLLMSVTSIPGILKPNSFGVFYATMIVWGIAKIIFDPSMQAYIADRISYRRRGMAMGSTELAWAGSLIVAAPLTGYLLAEIGLEAVFAMLGLTNFIGFLLVLVFVPADHPGRDGEKRVISSPLSWWRILLANPVSLAALLFSVCFSSSNETVFIVYGDWMKKTFDLALTELGFFTIV
ncbi:MAG TPA: MFS transporter, partial [Aggregatilineales bacterium]|nr:MFS transporter [Aggregatilineales bacterium]